MPYIKICTSSITSSILVRFFTKAFCAFYCWGVSSVQQAIVEGLLLGKPFSLKNEFQIEIRAHLLMNFIMKCSIRPIYLKIKQINLQFKYLATPFPYLWSFEIKNAIQGFVFCTKMLYTHISKNDHCKNV